MTRRRFALCRCRRLQGPRVFAEIRDRGGRKICGCLILNWRRAGAAPLPRLGVVTARSLGGAVVRSRARRLMREAFRLSQHHMAPDLDLILVARRSIVGKRLGPVVRDLHRALREAGLWREDASDPKTPCASSS